MDEKDILDKIASVEHWYHRIEIRPGIITPGINDSPEALKRLNIPDDCSGLKVLDLGARDGFFSFEFEKRGADVLAVDYFSADGTGFKVAAELLNSKVKYIQDNIYSVSKEKYGTFDIVLFLGLLYHLPDPLLALDLIRTVCSNVLYVETYVIDNAFLLPNGDKVPLDAISKELQNIPIMQFDPLDSLNKGRPNYWGPNAKCMERMLIQSNFSVVEKNVFGDRAVFKCEITSDTKVKHLTDISRSLVQ
jgi:tRNA (mo5U34)-methyltransferase